MRGGGGKSLLVPVAEMIAAAEWCVLPAHVHLEVLEEVVVLVAGEGDQHTNRPCKKIKLFRIKILV